MKNLPLLILLVLCGCPSRDLPQKTLVQIERVEDEPVKLSPTENAAFADALKPALAKGIADAINQFYAELYEGLGIESDADLKLIESVFENIEQQESTISITVHGNQYSKSESRVVNTSGHPCIQLSRIHCAEKEKYAIVIQYVKAIPVKVFQLKLVNNQDWQYKDIEISTKNIDTSENTK